ncbi:LOW QUALITY PROTEIN: protein FAM131A [Ciconia maguari]
MLPKSRRALTIQEIAALARSSLHGISQVVKEHVTKPTAMAQGRVAHLIEWKVCKPVEPPAALESAFSSYCHLSEGEQEARFAAGVAEQFAIAEAKLRAWSSVDGDDSNDESYDEDFMPSTESSQPADLPVTVPASALLRDLLQGHLCQLGVRHGSCEPESDSSHTLSPETLCSSLCSLEMVSPSELTAKLLGSLGGEDLLLPQCPPPASQSALRGLARLRCQDSLYSMSYTEACLLPAEDEVVLSKGLLPLHRKVSDVASSGVASLEEEEEAEEPWMPSLGCPASPGGGPAPPAAAPGRTPRWARGQALPPLPLASRAQGGGSGGHHSPPPGQCAPAVPRPRLATSLPSWIFA